MIRKFDKEWYLTKWELIEDGNVFEIIKPFNKLVVGKQCTIKLPALPDSATQIAIAVGGDWENYPTTILCMGQKLMGHAGDLLLDINRPIGLLYTNVKQGYIFSIF